MQETQPKRGVSSGAWVGLGVVVLLVALVILLLLNAPKGFDMDLSKIGAGKPALVFIYDPNLTVSNQQTLEMNKLRDDWEDQVHLLVADIGRPDAQRLMQQHRVGAAIVLLFDAEGNAVARERSLLSAAELEALIRRSL